MDHLYRGEEYYIALCGRFIDRDEHPGDLYFWSVDFYKNGVWKLDYRLYTWCDTCLEGVPDLVYINNTEL